MAQSEGEVFVEEIPGGEVESWVVVVSPEKFAHSIVGPAAVDQQEALQVPGGLA